MDRENEKNVLKLPNFQKVIGRRMLNSKRNQPCFYINLSADISELNRYRRGASKQLKTRLSTNDFFFKAMSLAICRYPLMAGRLNNDRIDISPSVNIGFAVSAADEKLFVPVIKGTEKLSIAEIAAESAALTQQAKTGKITAEQMSDAAIVLSGLGMFGIDSFIAIVPPDMPSILAIGKPRDTYTLREGNIEIRKLVSLTLAADARIISPDYAAKFLAMVAQKLETPDSLL
jgi:pyruvate dehydrogenase E2 component (dihydrolipoamide acetyltransferase)